MPQQSTKTIKFKGRNIKYKNIVQLAKTLSITRDQAKKLRDDYKKGNTQRFLVGDEGEILKYDLTKKPLILQPFLEDKQNIKRLRNKKFLDLKVNGFTTLESVSSNIPLQLTITGQAGITFSDEEENKNFSLQVDRAPDDIDDEFVESIVSNLFSVDENQVKIKRYNIFSALTKQKIEIVDMELRNNKPLSLTCLFNDVIDNKADNNDCIYKYLHKIHPKISSKKQKELKTTNDILEYSKKYGVRMVAYDIKGNVIADNYDVKSKGRYKNINFIAHNNHLYPIENQTLNKISPRKKYNVNNVFVDDVFEKIKYVIEELNIYPTNIKLNSEMDITNFNYIDPETKEYYLVINNPDYEECKKILKSFGLLDQLTPFTTLKNIYKIIETLYLKSFIDSFLPDNKHFIKSAFNYNNEENVLKLNELNDIEYSIDTIDKNKCYSWALRSLSFLISCDIKKHNWKLYDNETIKNHYLYVVKPEMSSILLPNTNIYTGEHLIYCKEEGLKFNIIESLECDIHDNYYQSMIDDLVKKTDMNTFKNIINIMIGKFERNTETLVNRKIIDICNVDQQKVNGGHYMDFNDEYKFQFEFEKDYNVLHRKPIAIQIKDKSRIILYNQLRDMKLDTKDIIQVKTDSFTFINRGEDYSKYINKNIDGWKIENYKKIKSTPIIDKNRTFKYINKPNVNRLYDCYAGCGKSYYIKSEIDNIYKNNNNTNYVILTPSHSSLKDYKKGGYNCNVIQKNTYFNNLPIEDNIYIDEMGMLDNKAWNLIYMCFLANKNIHAFGDFKQLYPVLETTNFNKENFINKIFTYKINLEKNFRNNFTKEYYDKLINSNEKDWLLKQVKKHNTKNYWEADVIIAYRNKTRNKYNNLMLKKLGFNDKYDVGVKIIAKDNQLSKLGIFNKFEYIIKSEDQDNIIITDDIDDITIDKKQYDTHFDLGYCRTLYSVQGDTINSFYYPVEEDKYFLGNREIYTLISRLKQELIKIPSAYNDFDFIKANTKNLFQQTLDKIKNSYMGNRSSLYYRLKKNYV